MEDTEQGFIMQKARISEDMTRASQDKRQINYVEKNLELEIVSFFFPKKGPYYPRQPLSKETYFRGILNLWGTFFLQT